MLISSSAQALHVGVGVANHTSGRLTPSLNAGFGLGSSWMVSSSLSGVATKAYYSNQYSVSVLKRFNFGKHWFGDLRGGMGLGVTYGRKEIIENDIANQSDADDTTQSDTDSGIGPAFRIAFNPLGGFYFSLDYVLTIGTGSLGNGWGDVGMFALGWYI